MAELLTPPPENEAVQELIEMMDAFKDGPTPANIKLFDQIMLSHMTEPGIGDEYFERYQLLKQQGY